MTSTRGRPRRRGLVFLVLVQRLRLRRQLPGSDCSPRRRLRKNLTPREESTVAGRQRDDPGSTTPNQLPLKNDTKTIVDEQTRAASETNPAVARANGTLAGRRSQRILSKLDDRISLPFRHGAPFGESSATSIT